MQHTMASHTVPQRKSIRTKNTVSYTGMTSAGATAPPASITKIIRKFGASKSSSSKSKPKRKAEGIRVQEGEPISQGAVSIFYFYYYFC